MREEIFANLAILLSTEVFVIFEFNYFSLDNINPKIYASFIFAKAFRFAKFAKLKTCNKFPLYGI